MSACPIPDNAEKVIYPEPGGNEAELIVNAPDPADESCSVVNQNSSSNPGGGPSTIIESSTQVSGPLGPTGPVGPAADCGLGFE